MDNSSDSFFILNMKGMINYMATFKMSNAEGNIAELHIDIYKPKEPPETNEYSYKNNLLTQKIKIHFKPGTTITYHFPIAFKSAIQSVLVTKISDTLKPYVRIYEWSLTDFKVKVLPAPYEPDCEAIEATAIGY